MTNNILACRCKNCGDTWNLGKLYDSMPNLKDRVKFVTEKKTCLRCGKEYIPHGHIYNMDEFVFNSVRNCNM